MAARLQTGGNELDMLDSLFPETTNTLEKAITLALELNNPAEFRKLYPAAARMLHRNGYSNAGVKNRLLTSFKQSIIL